jgi:CRP/FNR family transcriptional regulator
MNSAIEPFLDSVPQIEIDSSRNKIQTNFSDLTEVCSLLGIGALGLPAKDTALFQHVRYKTGERIYSAGQAFHTLHAVYSGFLKVSQTDDIGNEQVLNFPMRGDLIGADGIGVVEHASDVTALSDCDLIAIPFKNLRALSLLDESLELGVLTLLNREMGRFRAVIGMLGALPSEARVARFLLMIGSRFERMGYSAERFNLRMTRSDIGSYLGVTTETVCRTISALARAGLITAEGRCIGIKNREELRSLRSLRPLKLAKTQSKKSVRLHLISGDK